MPSNKSFRTKRTLGKKMKQDRPLPQWFALKGDSKVRFSYKRRHWRRNHNKI